ncbi:hypothetical protein YB2330_002288 [Saitoella coloradoensis]|uniref:uncharacterized protein n=1 Tax=Saitoella complicata (strain BCRC 22490 / CBS 7301 / JCM 7358 / NBRC 10748 / NRRL Y-17804) TaxID=698492 RepID=UPI0008677016|nr:uncharacterized protein SAICODRAFT_19716 [Saitoella complicata NRRL Y-17804]ODQ52538.1 hypothetical protein SAICODRAFT_19716 [Saitoella complicata NRRL Y-17804]
MGFGTWIIKDTLAGNTDRPRSSSVVSDATEVDNVSTFGTSPVQTRSYSVSTATEQPWVNATYANHRGSFGADQCGVENNTLQKCYTKSGDWAKCEQEVMKFKNCWKSVK